MTNVFDDDHGELALHLRNGQFFVHALASSQDEQLLHFHSEESFRETLEPLCPVRLACQQISAPDVLLEACSLVSLFDDLSRHGDSGASLVSDLTTSNSVLYHRLQVRELMWPILDDLLHEGKSIHGSAFDHVNYN